MLKKFYSLVVSALLPATSWCADCLTAPTITNALPVAYPVPSTAASATVTYTCQVGYEFWSLGAGTYNLTCSGGVWGPITNCQLIHCPALPVDDATTSLTTKASTYNTAVTVSCIPTYRLASLAPGATLQITCQANKQWSAALASTVCVAILCLHPISNYSTWDNSSTSNALTSSNYSCNSGYLFPSNGSWTVFQCTANGFWSPSNFFCAAVQCPPLVVPNAVSVNPGDTSYQSVQYVTCLPGYQYIDGAVRKWSVCTSNQTWAPAIPVCSPVTCQNPPVVGYATHDNLSIATYGTYVNYTCVPGYLFADGSAWRRTMCSDSTSWSPQMAACMPAGLIPQPNVMFVKEQIEATDAESLSSIPIGLMCAVFGIILVLDLITFPSQIAFIKRNLAHLFKKNSGEIKPEVVQHFHFPSTLSLGRGRVTPAPSFADMGFVREADHSSLFSDKNPLIHFSENDLRKSTQDIPRANAAAALIRLPTAVRKDRLTSAKMSVQKAIELKIMGNNFVASARQKKNHFGTSILPLHAENIDRSIGPPVKAINEDYEDDSEEDEYTDDDDDDEDEDDEDHGTENLNETETAHVGSSQAMHEV